MASYSGGSGGGWSVGETKGGRGGGGYDVDGMGARAYH